MESEGAFETVPVPASANHRNGVVGSGGLASIAPVPSVSKLSVERSGASARKGTAWVQRRTTAGDAQDFGFTGTDFGPLSLLNSGFHTGGT